MHIVNKIHKGIMAAGKNKCFFFLFVGPKGKKHCAKMS